MSAASLEFDSAIAGYATASFDDLTQLAQAGIESLSLVRLAAQFAVDEETEIDAARLVELRTIGDLKIWLSELAFAPVSDS